MQREKPNANPTVLSQMPTINHNRGGTSTVNNNFARRIDFLPSLFDNINDDVTLNVENTVHPAADAPPVQNYDDEQRESTVVGLSPGNYWVPLQPSLTPVRQPENVDDTFRAPTVPEDEINFVKPKYNFVETFDRMPFVGEKNNYIINKHNKVVLKGNNQPVIEELIAEKGGPRMDFIKKNKLTMDSTPADWFAAFLPMDAPNDKVSISQWCRFTNQKAAMSNAGSKYCYPTYKDNPFTPAEIERHIGLYFLNGLSPCPSVSMKFNDQSIDPVQGNDLVNRCFGKDSKRRHKIFKAFLCVQDPWSKVPSKKENPFHKVSSFLKWMQQVIVFAWICGRDLAGDEQTVAMQGQHGDKLRITFKKAGDGFMCDAICDDGYTFSFYFRNMPSPKKYIDKGWAPLHARMFCMFDSLES